MREYLLNILRLVKPYRARFIMGLACGFLSGMLAPALPVSIKLAVDTVFPAEQKAADAPVAKSGGFLPKPPSFAKKLNDEAIAWFRAPGNPGRVLIAISLIPATMIIRGLLAYLNAYLLNWVGVRAFNDFRARIFAHVMSMPMSFFSQASTGNLMSKIDATTALNNTINGSFATIIREPISIVVLVCTLVALQPGLALATILVFPICVLPVIIYGRKLRKTHASIHAKLAEQSAIMHESFTGARVIKAYNLEPVVADQFDQAAKSMTGYYMRSVRASELPGPMIEFIASIGVAFIFVYFAFLRHDTAPVGDMLLFFITAFSMYQPIKNLSRLQSQLAAGRAAMEPMYALLATPSPLVEPANPKPLQVRDAAIQFDNLSFSYGDRTVVQDINLTVQPGQMVALVGRTGSGKTTLTNLLLRFYDPQRGAVRIGGTDIREVATRDLRTHIAVVTQDTVLFNDTIRRNIELGRPGASSAEIEAAAKHAYAHEFIIQKPQGYDTIVGEKGVTLSGGQKQRIAIARAILRDAPILILDEATSSLDTEVERIVQAALEELMRGRTTICIAHRLSTIQKADVIVVLDQGRIIEMATHEKLLKQDGVYRRLYELQFQT